MNTLRTYLSTLTPAQKVSYAQRAGTTLGYLRKAICVQQPLGGQLARRLDEASNGAVSRYDLRPDIFGSLKNVAHTKDGASNEQR